MWELDYKESWAPKNWCFWTVVLEKTLESPLDCKEIQPVHPKGNQSWIFIGRTDAEAEAPIFWPPDAKNWLIWKDLDAGKDDWRWEEKGTTEGEMVGWHHQLNGHEFEQAPWVGGGLGSLVCCSPWGRKESDTTEWLNWSSHGRPPHCPVCRQSDLLGQLVKGEDRHSRPSFYSIITPHVSFCLLPCLTVSILNAQKMNFTDSAHLFAQDAYASDQPVDWLLLC